MARCKEVLERIGLKALGLRLISEFFNWRAVEQGRTGQVRTGGNDAKCNEAMTLEFQDFNRDLLAAGLDFAGPFHTDGKLHRFKAAGDHERNSWYVIHAGPPMAGAFGCWKRGIKETWCDYRQNLTQAEWDQTRRRWQEAEREREQAETERQAKARKAAQWILDLSRPVAVHEYLVSKGVGVLGEVAEYRGRLVLPLRDHAGELHSLQFISPAGTKRFLTRGKIAGCMFTIPSQSDGSLIICEGYATGATLHAATGQEVVCAMNAGNLLAVAQSMRVEWPERDIILAADNDQWTDGNPGATKAADAAKSIRAKLAVAQFKDTTTKPTDFNDLHQQEGINTVKAQIEAAAAPKESDDDIFQRLAKLPPAEYDRLRQGEADRVGIRVGTLDTEVASRRAKAETVAATPGAKVIFQIIEPWAAPVNGAALLDEIAAILKRFVVAPEPAITATSLFILHTYAFDLGDISPILFITGPTKRCGKSKLLAVILRLVYRPFAAASATAAGIYRVIELHHPTLCIDEVDAFIRGDEQLRGLINSGHTRDAAFHLGCVATGDKEFEPRRWSTWTPKIFSGIGRLADTIEDRAIIIEMVRRRKDEPCERLRYGMRFDDIPRRALRFVADHTEAIRSGNPALPDPLNDRAADNWTPLLILADLAGGDWPVRARKAAVALSGGDYGESLGLNGQLLADIRAVFRAACVEKMPSRDLAERLAAMEGSPWAEYGKERQPLTPNQIANMIRGFGVSSRTVRIGETTAKGYDMGDFTDAFTRYLPADSQPKGNSVTMPVNIGNGPAIAKVTVGVCDVSGNGFLPNKDEGCDVVTSQNPEKEAMLI